jgi:CubicO group peptidase (beta-lactamase class C family)
MKYSCSPAWPAIFIALLISACTQPTPRASENSGSVSKYSEPAFEDTAAFNKLNAAFPVIEKIFADYARENNMPAIAFGIVANGKLVYAHATGTANLETQSPATTKTLFRIASMSKSFTAMAILKLRDEGKLDLHDKVSDYISTLQRAGRLTSDAPEITIADLLTMSAGFPEDNPWGDRQLDDTDEELDQLIAAGVSFSNVPGITFEYSNLGYAMLGRIVTIVSKQPYQTYITENILKPLNMTDSKWEVDEIPKDQLAIGYRWEDDSYKPEPYLHDGAYGAMGGLICSIEDFGKYVSFHLGAWPPRNETDDGPVRRSSVREMHQPWRLTGLFVQAKTRSGVSCPIVVGYGYGLGWRKDCNGVVRVSHSGGLPGFGSEWRIYPEYGIGVVSFSNRTYGAPGMPNAIALDTMIHIAGLKPRSLKASPLLEQRREQIIATLQEWNEEQLAVFAENFFLDQPLERWREVSQSTLAQAGDITNVTGIIAENQLRGTFMIEGSKKNISVFFTLTPEREARIQQLDLTVVDK